MDTKFLKTIPVLPSLDIERDITWYKDKVGFETYFSDSMYAILYREDFVIHLQWHSDKEDDPLLGGSVIRVDVSDIEPIFSELIQRGTVSRSDLKTKTAWGTTEFGFHDLNNNAIFIMQTLKG